MRNKCFFLNLKWPQQDLGWYTHFVSLCMSCASPHMIFYVWPINLIINFGWYFLPLLNLLISITLQVPSSKYTVRVSKLLLTNCIQAHDNILEVPPHIIPNLYLSTRRPQNIGFPGHVMPIYSSSKMDSTVMTDDNDDNADDGKFDDTLSEILGASSSVSTSLDFDLAFGSVDSNVDPACIPLLFPLSPFPPPLASPPPAAAAGKPIWNPGVFTIESQNLIPCSFCYCLFLLGSFPTIFVINMVSRMGGRGTDPTPRRSL